MTASKSSTWSGFAKTILIPAAIALLLYVVLVLVVGPLIRRYRRYSNYQSLEAATNAGTSLWEPSVDAIPERTIYDSLRDAASNTVNWIVPRRWRRGDGNSGSSIYGRPRARTLGDREWEELEAAEHHNEIHEGGLFDVETGRAMIGFDVRSNQADGRNFRLASSGGQRPRAGHESHAHVHQHGEGEGVDESNRRLSRDLEEGFRDDSESERSVEGVTAGRTQSRVRVQPAVQSGKSLSGHGSDRVQR